MEHHAVCYVGLDFAKKELAEYFHKSDPDIHVEEYLDFGIGQARNITARAATTPVGADKQIFVVIANGFTHEAQNALLKLLEEPPDRSQFYLAIPKKGLLLPTLLSRLHIIESKEASVSGDGIIFSNFSKSTLGERLDLITKISKEKDVETIEEIVEGAEMVAHGSGNPELLRNILFVRDNLGRRGSSTKMLLESLALALPVK